ncbi:aarF domain-containing protein kinase 1 isoform X5 [Centrocercus urophasianus]|uniref:aarF domain-containing protein kinase 1 isoform X5 n=1 Tax=Centrocercus urophasianus TaxID=9002 RepID=UPI001C6514EE|nr:aarF domain-containing protein kinase 1 isoform X5 [Centrocercus urophasianus]
MKAISAVLLHEQGSPVMARRALKLASLAAAASGIYLYGNKFMDPNDFGVVRVGRAIATTAVITYDYLTSLRNVPYGSEEYDFLKSQVHLRSAERLRELCCANRGTFIKVGQHLGALDYLLPEEYTRTLKVLHSQAPQSTRQEIEQVIREDLGKEVPRIYWELSTRRVLLMEFMEGGQVNDKAYMEKNGIDVNEISRNLGKLYSEMIFVNGFVHCDPHPGNVLVKKCPDSGKAYIILLDHGLYQVLSESFRMDYCRLWQALIKADMKRVQKYSRRLGAGDLYPLFACMLTARSWESVNRGIDQSPVSASEDVEIRSNAAAYLPQITQLLNSVPRQMLLLLKTNDLLRGIESALHTRASASSFLNMSRCCIRAVSTYQRSKSHSIFRRIHISLTEALSLWQINLYELFLWLKGSGLGNWVIAFLSRMHHST